MNQDQLWKLFDIAPGLDYCQFRLEGRPRPNRGVASVVYKTAQAAAYALDKIHGLEYPPGSRVILKPDYDGRRNNFDNSNKEEPKQPDIFQIAETLAQATNLIQAAGLPRGQVINTKYLFYFKFYFNNRIATSKAWSNS